jgi:hypothetical protein
MHLPASDATGRLAALTSAKAADGGCEGPGGAVVPPPEPPQPYKCADSNMASEILCVVSMAKRHLFRLIIVDSQLPLLQMEIN